MSKNFEEITISHSEYIEDILAGTGTPTVFTLQSFPINAGQAGTFPWLSVIAQNYLYYIFEHLSFDVVSTAAQSFSSSTNIALGKVLGRHESDPTIAADNSLVQMENSYGVVVEKPANSWSYHCEISDARMGHYTVRNGAQPSNTDLRMYDQGFFEIASSGLPQASVNFGQLRVNYTVRLIRPFYIAGLIGNTIRSAHYVSSNAASATPLGTTSIATGGVDNIGLTLTSTTITFPVTISVGTYLVVIQWNFSTNPAVVSPAVTFTNCAIASNFINAQAGTTGGTSVCPANGTASTQLEMSFYVTVNAPGNSQAVITLGAAGTLGTATGMNLNVIQWNPLSL